MSSSFVEPKNARNQKYREQLEDCVKRGVCPFCEWQGIPYEDIQYENTRWIVIKNANPLPNTEAHFVIFPKQHLRELSECSLEQLGLLKSALQSIDDLYLGSKAFYWREGDMMVTGGTIQHLHLQCVAPKEGKDVRVVFGPAD